MSITFSGLATGIDTDSIVSEIMALERVPVDLITEKIAAEEERLEAFSQLKSKIDDLKSAVSDMQLTSQIRTTSVELSSDNYISASTSGADLGSYNISVAQLSQVQKSVTDGFASKTDSVLGTGTITVNGEDISITESNNSLTDLVAAINERTETTGVKASIINDGTGGNEAYHLVLTGSDSETSFTVESNLVDSENNVIDLGTTEVQSAQQAVAFIDGIKVVSSTNTISDAVSGLTINLNAVNETSHAGTEEEGVDPWEWADPPVYETTQLDIESDTDALKEKITTFVTAYNGVMDWISSGYNEFGATTDSLTEDDEDAEDILSSVLRGDTTVNSVKRQLQSVLTNVIDNTGAFSILSEIGISTSTDGGLAIDSSELDDALADNYNDVVALLSGDDEAGGVMKNYNSLLLDLTSTSDGMYATQKDAYDDAIDSYESQIETMESRLEKREETLRSQFTAMELLVSQLNSQGDYLTQALGALTGE